MSSALRPGFSGHTEEMAVSGEHLASVEALLASYTSLRRRRRWYLAALAAAVFGTLISAAFHRATGATPMFLVGFAALPMMLGGFGPMLLATWGALVGSIIVEGPGLVNSELEAVRYGSGFMLALVSAVFCEVARRHRIEAIDREFRLAQALRRSEELRAERAAADATQQAERDLAAAALRERDQQLARITATVPGIVYQLLWKRSGETRFLYVSERARDLFDLDPDAVVADAGVAWSRVHPDDVGGMFRSANACMEDWSPWRYEFRITDPARADAWRWALGSAICQPGPEPDSALFTGIFTDVTDQRRLEDELRQAQRIESLGRLAGGVAHDFNNLLTAITGEASLLESDQAPSSEVAQGLQRIRAAAESGAALSKQLLGFARRQVMAPRLVDANKMMQRAAPLLRRLLRESIRLELDVAPEVGMVRVDPGLFDQVLLNLAANARDAMPRGGTLAVRVRRLNGTDPDRAQYPGVSGDAAVEFVVADTGSGMPDAVRARAFEPFFTTKPVGEGSGLGLSTSYGIVTQAGGMMLLESREGHGTTVRIALPWIDPIEAQALDERSALRGGTERVLVVDDDDQVRRVTAEALRRFGYDVLEARGGAEAVAMARVSDPPLALLVSDVVMPELSGVDVVNAMRDAGITPRVLFVSGYPEGTVTQHGVVPDGVDLLVKPYAVHDLLRRVRAALDRAA
ncbi:MAG: response regulator [Gemmatimonadaceae bacterium]|nr:response regulator [Gemmatimonadaceae bacterium]